MARGLASFRRTLWGLLAGGPLLLFLCLEPEATQTKDAWAKSWTPFADKFCLPCHSGPSAAAGLRLDSLKSAEIALKSRDVFDHVTQRIKKKEMPPPGAVQPTQAQRAAAVKAIQALFAKAPPAPPDPGRVTMRRLNRAEYDNTLRDLLHIDFSAGADFPTDDVGYGFDNIGDVLTLSPLLFEKYLDAAEKAAERAIALPEIRTWHFDAGQLTTDTGNQFSGDAINLFAPGHVAAAFSAPKPGPYRVKVVAYAQQAGPEKAKMSLRLGPRQVEVFDVAATTRNPGSYEAPVDLAQGPVRISAHFINDYYQPNHPDPKMRGDRNLIIESIEVFGPLTAGGAKPFSHTALIPIEPDPRDPLGSAKACLTPFLKRAFRRPVSQVEVDRFAALVQNAKKEGATFEEGMRVAVAAALVSPHFLFRVEMDGARFGAKTRPLNDYELASRISYFVWSSLPDRELFALADAGKLKEPATLKAQAIRMLKDPRAKALTENFASQWLTLRKLESVSPDPELFPSFGEELRKDMAAETEAFFAEVVRTDASAMDFLDAPYTFLNERLAKHYGITGISGPNLRRVSLKGTNRGGLLTMASVLTVTSNPNRTSPVKRGKWLLENILGAPPPPPPPGLDSLEGDKDKVPAKTIKERMARHRREPSCAVCHAKMDPLGIAFENYDAVGRWRTMDGKFKVDATGQTAEGEKFKDAADLKKILQKRKDIFVRTLSEKLLTFALGRGLEAPDRRSVDSIASQAKLEGYRFSSLVKGIVTSDAFRRKRVD